MEPLWQQINAKEFPERGEDEIKETWEALILVGEEQGLEYVYKYLQKLPFWRRKRILEIKLLALKALEKSNHPDLVTYLEKISRLKNKSISIMAQTLLEHVLARGQRRKEEENVTPS